MNSAESNATTSADCYHGNDTATGNCNCSTCHTTMLPATDIRSSNWTTYQTLAVVYASVLLLIAVTLNVVHYASTLYVNRKRRRRPRLVLVLSLSTTDLQVALLGVPLVLATLLKGRMAGDCSALCSGVLAAERGLLTAQAWGTALLAIDRYKFLAKADTYRRRVTCFRVGMAVGMVWTLSAVTACLGFLLAAHKSHPTAACVCHLAVDNYGFYHLAYVAYFTTLCYIIPTTITFTSYGFLAAAGPRHRCPSCCQTDVGTVQKRNTLSPRRPAVLKTVSAILIVYTLLSCPYVLLNVAISTGHWLGSVFPHTLHVIAVLLLYTLSCCNPLLYGLLSSKVRHTLLAVVRPGSYPSGVREQGLMEHPSSTPDSSGVSSLSHEALVCREVSDTPPYSCSRCRTTLCRTDLGGSQGYARQPTIRDTPLLFKISGDGVADCCNPDREIRSPWPRQCSASRLDHCTVGEETTET